MSLLDTKTKQPVEKLDFDISYEDWLTPGDGISPENITIKIDRPELVCDFFTVSGVVLKVWLSAGVTNVTYKVTITVETDDGRIKQDEFRVKVKDT
jgi:hypothetical protein